MAKHLISLILDDDLGDIESETDLENFVWELRSCTHMDLAVLLTVYNIAPSAPVDEED